MITLTSDFGLKDPYVAEMKGVILSINPKAAIVDITHDIEKFNLRMAAFILASASPYFPKGTVHLTVVDPEVGTDRRAIIIQTEKGFFVGPDNGVLILAALRQGIEHVYELSNPKLMLPQISYTFHGRDVFAPAAAHLENSVQPQEFGQEIDDPVQPNFAIVRREGCSIVGEVIYVDSFGNIITNISGKEEILSRNKFVKVELPKDSLRMILGKTYAQTKPQQPIVIVGSHGFLEVAFNHGNAAKSFQVKEGDKITITVT